ncbi:MAG: RidA family protein [Deltaproteobacteria bacterium]|nr:RidA family protein [Deltaproteobacteria bacterium]
MNPDQKLAELFIDLPEPALPPTGVVHVARSGKMLIVGEALPISDGRLMAKGRVGLEVRLDVARQAARAATIQALAMLAKECGGTLTNIKHVVQLDAMLAASHDFRDHAKVLDGASELLIQLFGTQGHHTRRAVGVMSLSQDACVSISLMVETK